ncbi:MAG TPA: hypothetical protein VEP67_12750, partial [Thiobacillaceae bacterium]|nr:hypothetical protein [Thiobacillaceae bacterium]
MKTHDTFTDQDGQELGGLRCYCRPIVTAMEGGQADFRQQIVARSWNQKVNREVFFSFGEPTMRHFNKYFSAVFLAVTLASTVGCSS